MVERNDLSQYRKSGRSGSSSQPRNFSGDRGKGGGTAPPPSATNSSLSSNRRFKRSNNAQGGQSTVSGAGLNSNSSSAYAARALQNRSHLQPAVRADASTKGINAKPAMDVSMQGIAQAVPKVPSSQAVAISFDSASPTTPAKGDASRTFPLQFGSISPGFTNGMQLPTRTSSASPNLDEQQHDQARHDSLGVVPRFPIPPVPKKEIPRNDRGAGQQTDAGDAHQMSKAKRDAQVSSVPPVTGTHKASIHPVLPIPFHQPQIPLQFGCNPHIQSQGMAATSLPNPVPMPLKMGNASQLQQPMFVSSLPPHPMQPQGILHQGQTLNFTSQMGPQLPPQLGNLGASPGSQLTQQQAGKFAPPRKPFGIAYPGTHEELRLDKRADTHVDGGSSGSRSYPNLPRSQPFTSVPPAHPVNYSPRTYSPNPLFFPAPNSVPLTSTQINLGSLLPRLSYPVNQSPQATPFMNPPAHNSYCSKNNTPSCGTSEPSSSEHFHDVRNTIPSAPSASAQYSGRILSGPVHSLGPQGTIQRNNSDSERWRRATAFQKGLMPSPQSPLQVMHKAEKKYQVGQVADEEESKQRQLKAILNKLTRQNFIKLFQQVKRVNIDCVVTLASVVTQIFDKALMEPTFCEIYANFCYHLAGELPGFGEDNEKITFKGLLLNKCQEEFERGEREQEEADRADIGEVKQSEEGREEKRIKARRRMLGNIRLIGELYKKKMLTERIMHECIKKLLDQYENPDEEDIEALYLLMSTIGEIIDHPRAKEHMDAYFDMMAKLSNNMKLSSRVRFMLKDAMDLRKNKWKQSEEN